VRSAGAAMEIPGDPESTLLQTRPNPEARDA
jgi:hypothetical protein